MKKRTRYVTRLMLPFLCVITLATVLVTFSYRNGMQAIRSDIEANALNSAYTVSTTVDNMLNDVRTNTVSLAVQLSQEVRLNTDQFAAYNEAINRILNVQLNTQNLFNPVNGSGYVFSFTDDTVISKTNKGGSAASLYENYFKIDGLSYEEFKQQYSQTHYTGSIVTLNTVEHMKDRFSGWYVLQSVPVNPYDKVTGLVILHLDDFSLSEILNGGLADTNALCLLADKSGRRIYRQGADAGLTEEEIDALYMQAAGLEDGLYYLSEQMVCVCRTDNGMTIITACRTGGALKNLNLFSRVTLVILAVMIVISFSLAMGTSRHNAASVWEIIGMLPEDARNTDEKNALSFIRSSVHGLVSDMRTIRQENDRYGFLMKGIKLRRFLNGEYSAQSELILDGIVPDILETGVYYTLIMVKCLDGFSEELTAVCGDVIRGQFTGMPMPVSESEKCVVYILPTADSEIEDSVQHVAECLFEKCDCCLFVSNTVDNIMDIPLAYKDIAVMSGFTAFEAGRIFRYAELYQDRALYNSDSNLYTEERLKNTVSAGNIQETERVFDLMFVVMSDMEYKTPHIMRFYVYDLYRLAVHIALQDAREGEREEFLRRICADVDTAFSDRERFERFFDSIRRYCEDVCTCNSSRRENASCSLKNDIIEYVGQHFSNPDLSVTAIAKQFNITDKYLSTFFKEQTNEKLSNYIENKRIEHACTLLKNPDATIDGIARKSGYWQTHTFREAFKRVKGITPTEYRQCEGGKQLLS